MLSRQKEEQDNNKRLSSNRCYSDASFFLSSSLLTRLPAALDAADGSSLIEITTTISITRRRGRPNPIWSFLCLLFPLHRLTDIFAPMTNWQLCLAESKGARSFLLLMLFFTIAPLFFSTNKMLTALANTLFLKSPKVVVVVFISWQRTGRL